MRKPGGELTVFGPSTSVTRDTFTCKHCQKIVVVPPKARAEDCGGWCRMCAAPICTECSAKPCVPFEKRLERLEASHEARRSYGMV